MAFVFDHVTRLRAGCHVSNWPVWELAQPKGLLFSGKKGGRNHFPSSLLSPAKATLEGGLPSRHGWNESGGRCLMFEESFDLQDEGCDVRGIGAQIRYCLQFVVVQLSVHIKRKERKLFVTRKAEKSDAFTRECVENTHHTYISLRCCSLENKELSSTCNLLWLRSLRREKRQKLREKYTPWSVPLSCCRHPFGSTLKI